MDRIRTLCKPIDSRDAAPSRCGICSRSSSPNPVIIKRILIIVAEKSRIKAKRTELHAELKETLSSRKAAMDGRRSGKMNFGYDAYGCGDSIFIIFVGHLC
jgi:hypothetical protein